ncbi:hypothetical protein ACHAWF_009958 [Thalassiosira exigua]
MQPALTKRFVSPDAAKGTIVLAQEVVKLAVSLVGLLLGGGRSDAWTEATRGWTVRSWFRRAFLPASIYLVQNTCALLAYQNLDPVAYNVLNQTKTLSAALCCYLILGRRQSPGQVLALLLLLVAALVMEEAVSLEGAMGAGMGMLRPSSQYATATEPRTGTGMANDAEASPPTEPIAIEEGADADAASESSRRFTHGVVPILFASFLSGLAGAIVQKTLQSADGGGKGGRNALLFTIELCAASLLVLLASFAGSDDGRAIRSRGFFASWTPGTFLPVFTNGVGGVLVSLVIKHAGNVRKGFALIFGILISGILQGSLEGERAATESQVAGGMLAAASLWMHAAHPHAPRARAGEAGSVGAGGGGRGSEGRRRCCRRRPASPARLAAALSLAAAWALLVSSRLRPAAPRVDDVVARRGRPPDAELRAALPRVHVYVKTSGKPAYLARSIRVADAYGRGVDALTFLFDRDDAAEVDAFGRDRPWLDVRRVDGTEKQGDYHIEEDTLEQVRAAQATAYKAQRIKTRYVFRDFFGEDGANWNGAAGGGGPGYDWVCYMDDDMLLNVANLKSDLVDLGRTCLPSCLVTDEKGHGGIKYTQGGWCMNVDLARRTAELLAAKTDEELGWTSTDDVSFNQAVMQWGLGVRPTNSARWWSELAWRRKDAKFVATKEVHWGTLEGVRREILPSLAAYHVRFAGQP